MMIKSLTMQHSRLGCRLLALLAATITLSGCVAESQTPQLIEMPLPERIRNIQMLGPISAVVVVNGERSPMQAVSGGFQATVAVPRNSTSAIEVLYNESFEGSQLTLASYSGDVTVGEQSSRLELRRSLFNYDAHDDDQDSVNNLVEREQETDPRSADEVPQMVTVNVLAERQQDLLQSNFTRFFVEATVAGLTRRLQPDGNNFSGSFRIPAEVPFDTSVEVVESATGQSLVVASQNRTINSVFDQFDITFNSGAYNTAGDQDADGQTDLAELIAGTDPLQAGGPVETPATLAIQFSVPEQIQNSDQVFGQLVVGGNDQSAQLQRSGDTFSASVDAVAGQSMTIVVSILDNFANQPYPLATASRPISAITDGLAVNFTAGDWQLSLDRDSDGVPNYLERERGTNPFVADSEPSVTCTVSGLPALSAAPGEVAVLSAISSYVDCAGAPFALASADTGFVWNAGDDTVRWTVPGDTQTDQVLVELNVVNPDNPGDIYQTAELTVLVDLSGCSVNPVDLTLQPIRDAYIDGSQLINNDVLRIDNTGRQALIAFSLDPALGPATVASLFVTIGDDAGDGQISVFVLNDFQWNETDSVIVLPEALNSSNLVGATSSSQVWENGQRYQIGLSAERIGTGEVTLVARMEGEVDDVSFSSSQSASGPALELGYDACP
jgi:hypothetical protein